MLVAQDRGGIKLHLLFFYTKKESALLRLLNYYNYVEQINRVHTYTYLSQLSCLSRASFPHYNDDTVVSNHRQQLLFSGIDREELTLLLEALGLSKVTDSITPCTYVIRKLLV